MDENPIQEPVVEPESAQEPETAPSEPPRPTLSELLAQDADYQSQYDQLLSAQREAWQAESNQRLDGIRIDMALETAMEKAGARNSRAVMALIDREQISVKDGVVSGVGEQLEALKQSDPYLFADNGGKPYFGAPSSGGNPGSSDEAVIARRYKNNPWYHG